MSRKTFASTEVIEPEAPETSESLIVADPAPSFSQSDIEIPRLQVVQKMSELDIDAPVGSIVHSKESVLYRANMKAPSIILFAQKYWKEDVPFDSDEMPAFAHTEAEAAALVSRNGPNGYAVISVANIALLIAQTAEAEPGSDDVFQFELDGRNYALGKFTVQKKSYDTTYKALASFQLFNPKIDPSSIHWNLSSYSVTKAKYSWFVPGISPSVKDLVGPEAAEFVARLKG